MLQVNEFVYVPAETGFMYWGPGDSYTVLVTGAQSGGAYFMIDCLVAAGGGPPPHIHQGEDEAFFLLQGTVTLTVGEQTIHAGPGDFAHIPRGTVHAFTNNGAEAVRMVAIFSPAGMEGWFAESYGAAPDRKATPPPPSPEMLARMLTAAPKYGVVFA
jgi:quercetin dioxygenase-like cupin family protein